MSAPRALAPLPVTLVTGIDPERLVTLVTGLQLRCDALAAVALDGGDGTMIAASSDSDGRGQQSRLQLLGDCDGCTAAQAMVDLVHQLAARRRYDALLLSPPSGMEPQEALAALDALNPGLAIVDTVVCVLGAGWESDLLTTDDLSDRRLAPAGDDRPVALLLAMQLEAADVLVLDSDATPSPVLSALAPLSRVLSPQPLLDVGPRAVLATGARSRRRQGGLLDGPETLPLGGLRRLRWNHHRPLHPVRFYDSIDDLAGAVLRSSGFLRLAGVGRILRWESAGPGISLWPGTQPPPSPPTQLVLLGPDLDAGAVAALLGRCVLTDEEFHAGAVAWRRLENPFPWRIDDLGAASPGEGDPPETPGRG